MEPKPSYGEQDWHFWMITGINFFLVFLMFVSIVAIILSAYNSHWGIWSHGSLSASFLFTSSGVFPCL